MKSWKTRYRSKPWRGPWQFGVRTPGTRQAPTRPISTGGQGLLRTIVGQALHRLPAKYHSGDGRADLAYGAVPPWLFLERRAPRVKVERWGLRRWVLVDQGWTTAWIGFKVGECVVGPCSSKTKQLGRLMKGVCPHDRRLPLPDRRSGRRSHRSNLNGCDPCDGWPRNRNRTKQGFVSPPCMNWTH